MEAQFTFFSLPWSLALLHTFVFNLRTATNLHSCQDVLFSISCFILIVLPCLLFVAIYFLFPLLAFLINLVFRCHYLPLLLSHVLSPILYNHFNSSGLWLADADTALTLTECRFVVVFFLVSSACQHCPILDFGLFCLLCWVFVCDTDKASVLYGWLYGA